MTVPRATAADPGVVTFRLFASARETASASEALAPPGPTRTVLAGLVAGLPPGFGAVLRASALISDGRRLDPASEAPLPPGATVDVLPPFAGG
jgi:molybdopterin synthase sulfur carrier subunit